jgi:HAMP domain-containing protein
MKKKSIFRKLVVNFNSLGANLLLSMFITILICALIISFIALSLIDANLQALEIENIEKASASSKTLYNKRLNAILQTGVALSQNKEFSKSFLDQNYSIVNILLAQAMESAGIDIVMVVDKSGLIKASAPEKTTGQKFSFDGFIEHAITLGIPLASTEIVSQDELMSYNSGLMYDSKIRRVPSFNQRISQGQIYVDNGMLLAVAVPFADGAIVVADLLNRNYQIVDEIKAVLPFEISIYQDDVIITSTTATKQGARYIGTLLQEPIYIKTIEMGQQHLEREWFVNNTALTAYSPIKNHRGDAIGVLATAFYDENSKLSSIFSGKEKAFLFMFVIFIAYVFSHLLAFYVSRKIKRPLDKISSQMNTVMKGDFEHGVLVNSYQEINSFADSFNIMLRYVRKYIIKEEQKIIGGLKRLHSKTILIDIENNKRLQNVDELKKLFKNVK